jgi:hypothetical protein
MREGRGDLRRFGLLSLGRLLQSLVYGQCIRIERHTGILRLLAWKLNINKVNLEFLFRLDADK